MKLKNLEGRFHILFKSLMGEGSKGELFDTDKMVTINLKREESVVLVDRDDNLWELFKNRKGHYKLRRLKGRGHGA